MKIRDVRFRDAVQVGGITAPGRVSWRDEDGPATVENGEIKLPEDTFVPMSNVLWYRTIPWVAPPPERIGATEQATPDEFKAVKTLMTFTDAEKAEFRRQRESAPGKGKKR